METNDIACLTQPCPDPKSTEWQHLQELCCSQGGKFHCQSNDLSLSKRLCMEPIECPAGFYANIMLVSWPFTDESLCQLCPLTEFQPAPTPSHYFTRSHCHKKHTQCPFPQTLTEQFGNSTSEFMCRCNYLNGYRPVPKANHDCKAFASSSDCVCKLDPCPIGQTLNSTDYTCIKLTAEVLEDVQKEASENLLSNLDTLQQQLKRLVDITKRLAEPPKQAEYQWKAAFIPFGEPMCCVEEGKTQPPVTFMSPYPLYFLQDFSSHPFALISEDDLCVSVSPISLIAVLTILLIIAVENIQLFSRSEKKTQVPHTYIRLSLTTKKAMGIVQKEIENILPFLERHYGRLVVSVSPKKRHITLVVKQGQDQTPFPLRTFLRDIFSPLSMKNLKRCEKEADPPVKVFVLTGMTTDLKEIKQKFLTACFQENMAHNKGEITLLLPEKKTQDALLKKLQWTRSSLKDVFSKYHLHLDLVQEGSIRFKLRLASCPETLDELAHDQRIIQITQDLFLHESFRELACGQNLPVQFTCSVKMENVSVLTANNLYVQIGKHNKVTVVASPGHHADGGEDEEKNEESYIIMADNSVDVTGEPLNRTGHDRISAHEMLQPQH
ncbi:hypothetical protein C0Q70_09062 [Pomacea canaliculata]|uniref:Uncharacterized protein n=1 Tax=Pomacea canaliculata TaxID=400727 RepID=A0A2T7P8Q1_POMCA|nr:hypothetical protein C0Q70_09062 [Pomacea canaliculata]